MSARALVPAIVAIMAEQAPRLQRARELLASIRATEVRILDDRDRLLVDAWHLGRELASMKEDVGHGRWITFLEARWPDLDRREAWRYMVFYQANPNVGNSGHLTFSTESIRKFMWSYIPVKERPQLPGDAPVPPVAHHLTVINHFSKWERQLSIGLNGPRPPVEQMRRDFEPMIRSLANLLGKDTLLEVIAHADAPAHG